ncbi:MAG: hypothetical protein ACT4PT_09955 [Methanobacteriota archaeon]
MAGNAYSEMVFFIAAALLATALLGAVSTLADDLSGDMQERGKSFSKGLRTDITIINDATKMTSATLTVYAKNTGATSLVASLTTLMLDGVVATSVTYDVLGTTDDTIWRIGDVLKMVSNDLTVATGDHRVRVVAETGVAADLDFTR